MKYYIQTRQNYQKGLINSQKSDYSLSPRSEEEQTEVSVTARALEALMRLTEAHARLHLRDVATKKDAEMAISIFKHWREEANIRDEAELQTGMSINRQNTVVQDIMKQIADENMGSMPMSKILDRGILRGIDDTIVRSVVQKLSRSGVIYESKTGTYEFVN